jgi:hypothetical protein
MINAAEKMTSSLIFRCVKLIIQGRQAAIPKDSIQNN